MAAYPSREKASRLFGEYWEGCILQLIPLPLPRLGSLVCNLVSPNFYRFLGDVEGRGDSKGNELAVEKSVVQPKLV